MARLADTIAVTRAPDGITHVHIDGHELPWTIGVEPVSIDVGGDQPSAVRLTILARKVRVQDDVLDGITGDAIDGHTHDAAGEPVFPSPAALAAGQDEYGTVTCQRTGATWPRCSATCELVTLGNGQAVCDRDCDIPKARVPK